MPIKASKKSIKGTGSVKVGQGSIKPSFKSAAVRQQVVDAKYIKGQLEGEKSYQEGRKIQSEISKSLRQITVNRPDMRTPYIAALQKISNFRSKQVEREIDNSKRGEMSRKYLEFVEQLKDAKDFKGIEKIIKSLDESIKPEQQKTEQQKPEQQKPKQQKPEQRQVVSRFKEVVQRVGKQAVRLSKLEAKLGKTVLNKISNNAAKNSLYNSGVYTKDNFKLHLEEKTKSLNSVTAANIKSIIKSYKDIKTTEVEKQVLINKIKESGKLGKLDLNEIRSIEGMGKGSLEYLKRQINSDEFKRENLQKIIITNNAKREEKELLKGKSRTEKRKYYKQQKIEKALLADIESVKEQNPNPRDTKLLDELKNSFKDSKALTQNELDKSTAIRKEAEAAQQKEIFDMGRNRELAARIVKILKNAREEDARKRMRELLKQITEANKQNKEVVFKEGTPEFEELKRLDPNTAKLSQKNAAKIRQREAETEAKTKAKQVANGIRARVAMFNVLAARQRRAQQGGYTKKKHRKLNKKTNKNSKILKTRKVKKTRKHLNNKKQ